MNLAIRPRRNRRTAQIRDMVKETRLTPHDFVYPLFFHAGEEDIPIQAMPGCTRWSLQGLVKEAGRAKALGIPAVILFPAVDESLKTPQGEQAYNPEGIVPVAVSTLKQIYPDLMVITDVALDPYNSDGHDGVVKRNKYGQLEILNDITVEILCRQALCQAEAGVDIVAPSDMMDGRIAAIRTTLDHAGFQHVGILSYTAKYASAFYGPFRGALDSAPKEGDKKTYQMDPANKREALLEMALDESEGADMLMVKPAGAYLDVISAIRDHSTLPLGAYQVSGEYLMIKSAAAAGWLDEEAVMMESLLGIKRAGADFILTYFAPTAAEVLYSGPPRR